MRDFLTSTGNELPYYKPVYRKRREGMNVSLIGEINRLKVSIGNKKQSIKNAEKRMNNASKEIERIKDKIQKKQDEKRRKEDERRQQEGDYDDWLRRKAAAEQDYYDLTGQHYGG